MGVVLKDIIPPDMPQPGHMLDLSNDHLKSMISKLNKDTVRIHIFKYLSDLHMFEGCN